MGKLGLVVLLQLIVLILSGCSKIGQGDRLYNEFKIKYPDAQEISYSDEYDGKYTHYKFVISKDKVACKRINGGTGKDVKESISSNIHNIEDSDKPLYEDIINICKDGVSNTEYSNSIGNVVYTLVYEETDRVLIKAIECKDWNTLYKDADINEDNKLTVRESCVHTIDRIKEAMKGV